MTTTMSWTRIRETEQFRLDSSRFEQRLAWNKERSVDRQGPLQAPQSVRVNAFVTAAFGALFAGAGALGALGAVAATCPVDGTVALPVVFYAVTMGGLVGCMLPAIADV